MSPEVVLAAGYAGYLVAADAVVEWLSAHTHKRALRYRTGGFSYDEQQDHWQCPEGQQLWPHEFDTEQRLVRYRAKAHICNGCPRKHACTDCDQGREVVRPLDPWPHSEAGRFHRGLSLALIALSLLVPVAVSTRHHEPLEAALLLAMIALALTIGRWLLRDFRAHPARFPDPTAAQGLRMASTDGAGRRDRSRWASQNRTGADT